jgi:hypothetical protein
MNNEFIPYEQALELKELGFNEPCFYPFTNFSDLEWSKVDSCYADFKNWNDKRYGVISAPLYQQAFRWFREKYDLHPSFGLFCSSKEDKNFDYEIINHDQTVSIGYDGFKTYEEAELACLNKLIEIIKTKQYETSA